MLRLQQAADKLDVTISALCTSDKYQPFRHTTDNRRVSFFDVEGYLKKEADLKELLEKTRLFVEYLVHEEELTYSFISKATGIYIQSISAHSFAADKALTLLQWFRDYRPWYLTRFDSFYNWKHIVTPRQIKFKEAA